MIDKNDKVVIFLKGSLRSRNRCGFLTDLRLVWREKTTSIPPLSINRDKNVNLPKYKKIEMVSSWVDDKLMLRLHRVVVLKGKLGFTLGGNIGSF